MPESESPKVVYLFGAGATHACVRDVGSAHGVLMRDLNRTLADEIGNLVRSNYSDHLGLQELVNSVIGDNTDYERLITFLDDSPSATHRKFADELRHVFEEVLRDRLELVENDVGEIPVGLYTVLFDIYKIPNFSETLGGCLTLNYDVYIEQAIGKLGSYDIDLGISPQDGDKDGETIEVIKLHGSFNWENVWPVKTYSVGSVDDTLWIPPGIQKAKSSYPFNLLWGRARELLDCDVLRVVGCSLGPNDWDLISLLFTTRHVYQERAPYTIELIDAPWEAKRLKEAFPSLEVQSILELESIGPELMSTYAGSRDRDLTDMDDEARDDLFERIGTQNWFRLWLEHKTEGIFRHLGTVETKSGVVQEFLE